MSSESIKIDFSLKHLRQKDLFGSFIISGYQKVRRMATIFSEFLVRVSFSCCTAIKTSSEIMASWLPV